MNEYKLFVRECRKKIAEKNLSQRQVAEVVGGHLSSINGQLSGRMGRMSAQRAFDMARLLGISMDRILEEST